MKRAALSVLLGLALPVAGGAEPSGLPGPLVDVGFEQRLGAQLPTDAALVDEEGRAVTLAGIATDKPTLLAFVYYDCPMLCGMVISGLTRSLKTLDLEPGRDFEVVFLSFDSSEGPEQAMGRKRQALEQYGRPETADGWHFLTGGEAAVSGITEAAGFRYAWVEETGEWAHAAGVLMVTPDGRIARTLYGIDYPARDLRLALVDTADGGIGSLIDQVLLFCYHYDPVTGRYSFAAMTAVRLGGLLTVAALAVFAIVSVRRERRDQPAGAS